MTRHLVDVRTLTEMPMPGHRYLVPTIAITGGYYTGRIMPVIGELHDDREILHFPEKHYHLDQRFMNDWEMDRGNMPIFALAMTHFAPESFKLRVKMCRRIMPDYPHWGPRFGPELERAFKNVTLKEDRVCPHRGMPLNGLPQIQGCVTCPLHGLTWDMTTGRLHPHHLKKAEVR